MAAPDTGMVKEEMRPLLKKATQEKPVRFAFGIGKDPNAALLLLDKLKAPRGVESDLLKKFPDARNTRFGTAYNGAASEEEDSKLIKFVVNKAVSGMAKRLIKTLKGTGFNHVEIVLEDGSPVETHEEAEEEVVVRTAPTTTDGVPEPPPPPPPQQTPKVDPADLQRQLAALIPKIPGAAGSDAGRLEQLKKFAVDATTQIKTNNLAYAATAIEQLRRAIEAPPVTGAGAVAFGKSRLIWLSTRKKMESDIETILGKILEHYKDQPIGPQIEQAYRSKTGPLLEQLDESLADRLDEAVNATDPAIRANLVGQAKELIARYQKTVESEPTLAQLDTNPFVPVALVKTLTTTLNALAATVR